jgi:deoxycytidylate deaminase/dephospho-CoA kinase
MGDDTDTASGSNKGTSRVSSNNPHIIGLTGSFGSGCTYIAENVLSPRGYANLSLSKDVLRPLFQKKTGSNSDGSSRHNLQEFGDQVRESEGPAFLAKSAIEKIEATKDCEETKWVIDSIRNPHEVRALREFSRNFFLFGVYADKEKRWARVREKYQSDRGAFDEDDQNDTGQDNPAHGQRVGDCFYEADVVLTNDDDFTAVGNEPFDRYAAEVDRYVKLVQQPLRKQQPITQDEALMAMAYAMSQRSSCRKRKVGAVIVDRDGNVISSGYNEVPAYEKPCSQEYNACHRDWLTEGFLQKLKEHIPEAAPKGAAIKSLFRKEFKILDYCRALHAEENAIVNLARNGRSVPLDECTLYTTTYPCRMCSNKIVNVGIRQIVYVEPYPDEAAKSILKNADVKTHFFKGVTFKAYSRLYGEEK